jgi:hypothetical protein
MLSQQIVKHVPELPGLRLNGDWGNEKASKRCAAPRSVVSSEAI